MAASTRRREARSQAGGAAPTTSCFIPNGIWHTTVAVSHNISLIFDQLNGHNFQAWKKDIYDYSAGKSKLKALAGIGLASTLGALCQLNEKLAAKST